MDLIIRGFSSINKPKDNTILFVRNWEPVIMELLASVKDVCIICDTLPPVDYNKNYILTNTVQLAYFSLFNEFGDEQIQTRCSSMVSIETSNIGTDFSCGNFVSIGRDVVVGNNCSIGNNVTINGKTVIGDNVFIDSNVCIGNEGFGHYQTNDNKPIMIRHQGGIKIGNDVFIGSGTVISKGTIDDTVIGDDVKIDAMCKISHNAIIGNRVLMAGNSGVAGSVIIGDDTWLSGGCRINTGIVVGADCFIGFCSVVNKNIPDGKRAIGCPARIIGNNTNNPYKL